MKLKKKQLKKLRKFSRRMIKADPSSTFSVPPETLAELAESGLKFLKLKRRLKTLEAFADDLEEYLDDENFTGDGLSKREGYFAQAAIELTLGSGIWEKINAAQERADQRDLAEAAK